MKRFIIFIFIFLMLVLPAFSLAQVNDTDNPDRDPQTGKLFLVPCGHANPQGVITNPCSFKDFMTMINNGITFILKFMVIPIAAIMFAYAGFELVTSGGNTEKKGKAKNIFTNTVFGLVLAAGAWLIIKTILSILGFDGGWIGF